ncbi:MAG: cyclopropane-fatty-acyl-phospholipid synthase family protein [Planctomycetaceae bacterium]
MNRPATAAQPGSTIETKSAPRGSSMDNSGPIPTASLSGTNAAGRTWRIERALMRRVLSQLHEPPIGIALWDGTEVRSTHSEPRYTLRIHDRATLWRIAREPQFGFGEAYADGRVSVVGDFAGFLRTVVAATAPLSPAGRRKPGWWRRSKCTLHSSKENIHRHYDIGNEFYKLWLDDRMLYTCAYYREPEMTLEQAQIAKMDHVCRKLRLQPGETVIEAGCGWGGFALHMAREYGVSVRAYNISREQIRFAREAARRENLDGKVEFVEDDWRNCSGSCDAFVSIGMLEHVGIENYTELGAVVERCLHGSGRGLIHSIGRNFPQRLNSWIERRIFPGAQPPALSEAMDIFESQNLSVLDVENLRLHYACTCRDWWSRFEERLEEVRDMFDDRFVRMWRLYLGTSMVSFECGTLQLFQILFAPGLNNSIPWTRAHQYVDAPQPASGEVWKQMTAGMPGDR